MEKTEYYLAPILLYSPKLPGLEFIVGSKEECVQLIFAAHVR